jgi:predicted nucleic acid-binding protein
MPGHFFDTSALVKHYHLEAGTLEVDRIWNEPANLLFASRLAALEMTSAFAAKVRAGTITTTDFDALTRRFSADVAKKRIAAIRLLVLHTKEAERLIRQHGLTDRLRALDALHLAVALDRRARGLVLHFVCSDLDLLGVAKKEGFAVINPENP